jgi:putative SOS response-associated peptidase YedK
MIERYSLTSLDDIPDVFGAAAPAGLPRFNIAPLQIAPICTAHGLALARWGVLPPWRGHGGKRGPHILHAPLDALDPGPGQVPVLRNAFKSQRCLVIADGFYLWWRAGKKAQPMWLHPVAERSRRDARTRTIAFAGVTATHRDDGQASFAIVVGAASPLIAPYDSTMPVVVPPDGYTAWLTGPRDRARELLTAALAGPTGWRAEPVSTWVNSVDHDDARCIEPLGNPAQGELF